MYPKDIAELIFDRRNEQNARASTADVKGAVKIHHLVLGAGGSDRLLDLGPLDDEISKRLRLDGRLASEFDGVSAELNSPLDDAAIGHFVFQRMSPRGNLVTMVIL